MAGVSAGTVDRILHNRGKVSAEAAEKVEKVLQEIGYRQNIHTSAISLKRKYNIVGCMPDSDNGDYWYSIRSGISRALDEYSDIDINYTGIYYDQFDVKSCERAYKSVMNSDLDAVIIGPTFEGITKEMCHCLEDKKTPYAFVDAAIEDLHPVIASTTDQKICGRVMGKIMSTLCGEDGEMVLFHMYREGGQRSLNSTARENALKEYIREIGKESALKESFIRLDKPSTSEDTLRDFFKSNPQVKVAGVLNSRGYFIADALKAIGRSDVKTIAFDITYNNRRCIKDDSITALICQKPDSQGFTALKRIIEYLIYGAISKKSTMPVDIVLKENLDLYLG